MYDIRVTLIIVLLYAYVLSQASTHAAVSDVQKNKDDDHVSSDTSRSAVNSTGLEEEGGGQLRDTRTDIRVFTNS